MKKKYYIWNDIFGSVRITGAEDPVLFLYLSLYARLANLEAS
jgi:hypothetical protein